MFHSPWRKREWMFRTGSVQNLPENRLPCSLPIQFSRSAEDFLQTAYTTGGSVQRNYEVIHGGVGD